MLSPYKVGVWAAVSTRAQAADDRVSLTAQLEKARALCRDRGWSVVDELVVKGHSREYASLDTAMGELPELRQIFDLARAGKINLVVCYDLNRFRGVQMTVVKTLAAYGCQVYSLSQPLDPSPANTFTYWESDTAHTVSTMSAFTSDAEMRALRRRYATGMPARMTKHGLHFNNKLPFGYRKPPAEQYNKKAVAEQVPSECVILLEMKKRYEEGASSSDVAAWLKARGVRGRHGKWMNQSVVLKILTNPWYAGLVRRHTATVRKDLITGKRHTQVHPPSEHVLAQGSHPPLWTVEEWEHLVALRELRAGNMTGKSKLTQVFTRLLRCSECGAILRKGNVRRSGDPIYKCPQGRLRDGHAVVYEADVIAGVRDVTRTLLRNGQLPAAAPPDHTDDVARLEAALAENDGQRAQAQRLAMRKLLTEDDLAARQEELQAERQEFERQLALLKDTEAAARRRERARAGLAELMRDLDTVLAWPAQQLNAHLAQIFGRIIIEKKRVLAVELRE